MITREQKNAVIKDLKEKIESSKALFLTNTIGMTANDVVALRKKVRDANGGIVVTRNSLFGKAAQGTYAEELLSGLKGTNAVAFAFEDAPGVAKALYETNKEIEVVTLGKGYLNQELLDESKVAELAKLPSRDEMLGTLLATMMAPVSSLARVLNAVKDECESQGVEKPGDLKVEAKAEETAEA
ncbi:MAG: 50S ribosomal protein L10 [Halobacteriovoraceae bacterium]|nr:50S ribosomal protein L10 [Halobacteriovoraceae bacterium]|tara:strand:- start:383 stop:934 length:552 start_codon:yes stop_codon:yes gene_type:complete